MREKFSESRAPGSGASAGPAASGGTSMARVAARSTVAAVVILALLGAVVWVVRLDREAAVVPATDPAGPGSEVDRTTSSSEAGALAAAGDTPRTPRAAGAPCLIDEGCSIEPVGGGEALLGHDSADRGLGLEDAPTLSHASLDGVVLAEGSAARAAETACLAAEDCRRQIAPDDAAAERAPSPGNLLLIAAKADLCGIDAECAEGAEGAPPLIIALGRQPKLSPPRALLAPRRPASAGPRLGPRPSSVLATSNSTGGGNTPAHIPSRGSVAGAIQRVAVATGEGGEQVIAALQDMPEPATLGLLVLGLLGLGVARRSALRVCE